MAVLAGGGCLALAVLAGYVLPGPSPVSRPDAAKPSMSGPEVVVAPPTPDELRFSPKTDRMAPAPLAAPRARPAGVSVRYRFENGSADGGFADDAGMLPLRVVSAGGVVSLVEHGGGKAVRFPPRCARYAAPECARVILEASAASMLNPGGGPLRFGAAIHMTPEETTKGGNVLQKGYSVGASQFKLQVDGGRASCVLVGVSSSHIYVVTAHRTVADGRWHRLDCARVDDSLTISVDGAVSGQVRFPATLSVYNSEPLRIGGKGNGPNNDQFNGVLDDVYVTVGPQ